MRPHGTRWWQRFPKYRVSETPYFMNKNSICFVPINENVEVVGFGFFSFINKETLENYRINTTVRVTDENDSEPIFEKKLP